MKAKLFFILLCTTLFFSLINYSSLYAKPLSSEQLRSVNSQLRSSTDSDDLVKLRLLLVQHAQETKQRKTEIRHRRSLEKHLKTAGGFEKVRFNNLYALANLQYKVGRKTSAIKSYKALLQKLPLREQELRDLVLQHLSVAYKKKNQRRNEEKYLAKYVISKAKGGQFYQTKTGFLRLVQLAKKNRSKKTNQYLAEWYRSATKSGKSKNKTFVLTEWVNFASSKKSNFTKEPYVILIQHYKEQQDPEKLEQVRFLYAQATPYKKIRFKIYEEILNQNIKDLKETDLGLLTRLLKEYTQSKYHKGTLQVLKMLAYREFYPEKAQALKRLAQLSLRQKDWATSYKAHEALLKKEPFTKSKAGALYLNNLIQIAGKLHRETNQLELLELKATKRSRFISDKAKFTAYNQAMGIYKKSRLYKEAEALYQKMQKVTFNKSPYKKDYQIHTLGGILSEDAQDLTKAREAYQSGLNALLNHNKPDLTQAVSLSQRIYFIADKTKQSLNEPLKQIISIYKKQKDYESLGKSYLFLGQSYEKEKDVKSAIQAYNQSLKAYKKAKNKTKSNQVLTLLLNMDKGNGAGKLKKLLELEKQQKQDTNKAPLIATMLEIGNYYYTHQEFPKATKYYLKAFRVKPRTANSIMAAYYAGRNLSKVGRIDKANEYFDEALGLKSQKLYNPQALVRIRITKANNFSTLGKYEEGIKEVQSGLTLNVKGQTLPLLEAKYNILLTSGNFIQAQAEINSQIKLVKGAEGRQRLLLFLARSYMGDNKPKAALKVLRKALKLSKKDLTSPMAIKIQIRQAQAYKELRRSKKAIALLTKLAKRLTSARKTDQLPNIYLQIAGYQIEAGKLGPAFTSNKKAQSWSYDRPELNALILMNFAKISQKQDRIQASLNYFTKMEKLVNSDTPLGVKAEMFYQRGYSNLLGFQFDKAQKDFQSAEKSYILLKKPYEASQSKMAQANVYLQLGKVTDAERIYQEMLQGAGKDTLGDINNALAFLYSEMGQYNKALLFSEKAEAAYTTNNQKLRGPEVLNARGLIYLKMGDFGQAEVIFHKAIKLNKKFNNPLLEAELTNNLGGLYKNKGELAKAREQLMKTAELQSSLGFESQLALTYNNIGSVYLEEEKFEDALEYLRRSREFSEKFKLKKELSTSWNNEGILFFRQSKFPEAKAAFSQAISLQEELELRIDLARTQNNLSIIASKEDRVKEALDLVQKAVATLSTDSISGGFYRNPDQDEILAPDMMKNFLQNKGGFLKILGDKEEDSGDKEDFLEAAYQSFALSIKLIESLRSQIQAEEAQQMLMQSNIDIYQQLISILYDLGNLKGESYHKEAFYYAEMSRARSFLDQLAEQAAKASLKLPEEIRAREEALKGKIANLDQKIFIELKKPSRQRDSDLVEEWQLSKTETQIKYRKLTKELEKEYPVFASLKYPKVYKLQDVRQNILKQDSRAVMYFLGADRSYGFSVTKSDFKMVALPPNADIDTLIRKFRVTLVDPLLKEDEEDDEMVIDNSQTHVVTGLQIYRTILEPLLGTGDKKKSQLLIIPDGVLYYLPFETVLVEIHPKTEQKFANGREYLLHRYALNYSPSTSVLGSIKKQVSGRDKAEMAKRKDFIGFGDPEYKPVGKQKKRFKFNKTLKQQGFYELSRLFNTIKELKEIQTVFKDSNQIYLRKDTLESTVKRNLSGFKYIHFATHGILDERNPEFSGVVMNLVQPDAPEDGFLQASEIFDLSLNSDLVVLSACETGLGKVIKGEGMVGLTRAFLFAGSPSIIVSLWTVADDSTSMLMIYFYKHLAKGLDKDEALRQAKLELMNIGEDKEYSAPFYWGPFVLNGTRS